jgi:hypothetical protein
MSRSVGQVPHDLDVGRGDVAHHGQPRVAHRADDRPEPEAQHDGEGRDLKGQKQSAPEPDVEHRVAEHLDDGVGCDYVHYATLVRSSSRRAKMASGKHNRK